MPQQNNLKMLQLPPTDTPQLPSTEMSKTQFLLYTGCIIFSKDQLNVWGVSRVGVTPYQTLLYQTVLNCTKPNCIKPHCTIPNCRRQHQIILKQHQHAGVSSRCHNVTHLSFSLLSPSLESVPRPHQCPVSLICQRLQLPSLCTHIPECGGAVEIWQNWGENSPSNVGVGQTFQKWWNFHHVTSCEGRFIVQQIVYAQLSESDMGKQKEWVTHFTERVFPSPPSLSLPLSPFPPPSLPLSPSQLFRMSTCQKRAGSLLPEQKAAKYNDIVVSLMVQCM